MPARHNLGCIEYEAGNLQRATKHWIISAKAGLEIALGAVKKGYMSGLGCVTKDEYESTLRAYHERQKEMKSGQREEAATSGMFRN